MKHRSVVANFIFKWTSTDKTDQKVALFKRSTHLAVRSYPDKYAPISGNIEDDDPSPVEAAAREIREETQLIVGQDIVLEFTGNPYSFEDEQAQRSWAIYPFGWQLKADESKIKIDWEHSGWEWFDPQKVLDGTMANECVPKLNKSLQRVFFGPNGMFAGGGWLVSRGNTVGRAFLETIEMLKTDTTIGARGLATEALRGLLQIAEYFTRQQVGGSQSKEYWHALRVAAFHFIYSARPSMNSAISAVITDALSKIRDTNDGAKLDPTSACRVLESCISGRSKTSQRLAEAFTSHLQKRYPSTNTFNILTLSSSSTIFTSLIHLLTTTKLSLNLTIFESRPAFEGASLASKLTQATRNTLQKEHDVDIPSNVPPRLTITLAPESHIAYRLHEASATNYIASSQAPVLLLLGADRITPLGHVSNKMGSATLAITSTSFLSGDIRVMVLSEEDKIARVDPQLLQDYQSLLAHYPDVLEGSEEKLNDRELGSLRDERHSAEEVYAAWPGDVQDVVVPFLNSRGAGGNDHAGVTVEVENVYFETVKAEFVNAYIGENGEIGLKHVLATSIRRAELEESLFGDLYP